MFDGSIIPQSIELEIGHLLNYVTAMCKNML